MALKLDVNGACYGIMPDCPLLDFPNANTPLFYTYVALGQSLGRLTGRKVIGPGFVAGVACLGTAAVAAEGYFGWAMLSAS